jgi:hypothetical protein
LVKIRAAVWPQVANRQTDIFENIVVLISNANFYVEKVALKGVYQIKTLRQTKQDAQLLLWNALAD